MKRRITLYIASQKADLDDDALVLLNIRREDLYNPAVVLNSYSQAVTLPGTAANDRIFGHYFRADHSVAGGFNPLVRVSFSIFADTGDVLVAGYCKLLNVTAQKGEHTYEVQLYGSLGEFIYGLAYDADGNKKSLASLDYLGGGDTELNFVIDKTAVADAWARLGGDTSKPAMWDVVNFAPCYNGIPDGDFDAGKALAKPGDVGLTPPAGYNPSTNGYVIVNLPEGVDEWAAHDLRSYLQRPVLSVKALLEAIAKPENNGGWTLDLSDIDTAGEWPYLRTWLTRPLLPSLGTFKQTTGSITATPSSSATSGPDIVSIALANVPSGTEVTLRASFTLQVNLASAPGLSAMQTRRRDYANDYQSVWFVQLVGYASDNSVVAASPVTIFGPNLSLVSDLAQFAEDCTFTPTLPTGQTAQYVAASGIDLSSLAGSGTAFSSRGAFSLETAGKNMASAKVIVKRGTILWNRRGRVYSVQNLATLYTDTAPTATAYAESTSQATGVSVTATTESSSALRSGSLITKQMLLSTEGTPADYLLAICKSFGLYILTDGATKTARIVRRSTLYQNETIDLTERVDTSQEVELQPLAIESKYYVWKHEDIGAAFGKEYKETSGRDYGAQRVNTGYDFDASKKNVLDGVVLKGTAAVRASGRFWCYLGGAMIAGTKVEGYFWTGSSRVANANMVYYQFPVDHTKTYIMNGAAAPNSGWSFYAYVFLDSGGNLITSPHGPTIVGPIVVSDMVISNIPANCAYIAVNTHKTGTATLQVTPTYVPALFMENGMTFTAWGSDGQGEDTPIAAPMNDIVVTQYADGYDIDERAQFEAKDGKPVDGADVLLFAENYFGLTEFASFEDFQITDDVPDMDTIAGKPCWLLGVASGPLSVPHFSRYVLRTIFPDPLLPGETSVWRALDFGIPAELDIPNITYDRGTIYEQAWKRYVADRLDKDTKVLRCRVRLDGLQVGQGLLRKFYWYRGSLWALNKITNYSLTTYDPAECEFIQVQDIDNYTTQY